MYTTYDPSKKYDIKKGQVGVVWLGQAGFLFIDSKGHRIMLDPYASDSCERLCGFKRLSAFPFKQDELECDSLLISHAHEDHYDMDYVPALSKKCKMKIYAAPSAAALCKRDGIDMSTVTEIARGQSFSDGDIAIRGVFSDHGEMAPDALGFVLNIDGFIIYVTGDTGLNLEKLKAAVPETPDLLIAPINGAYGNLNEEECAKLTVEMGAKAVLPCHYWTFMQHGGNPQKFDDVTKEMGINDKVRFMSPGSIAIF